jgi:deoxyribonuclease-4
MQIFVKNNMQWFARPVAAQRDSGFSRARAAPGVGRRFLRMPITSSIWRRPIRSFHANSVRALAEELIRADQLGLPFLVLHPGAHLGAGEAAGLEKVVASIDQVFRGIPKVKTRLALETTAGQGSCLGHTFEHLAEIMARVREPERLCVCLDTAHVFAAGFDLTTAVGTQKMFRTFDRVIGLEHLAALHLNDSKTERGSRVDRHEHIGKGKIGLEAFRLIMRDRRFRKIPKVLETPKGKELREDVENLKVLRSFSA